MAATVEASADLYIRDVPPQVTVKELEDAFSSYGPVFSVRHFHSYENPSLSNARITFSSSSHASKALACINNLKIRGMPLKMMRDQNDGLAINTVRLVSEASNLFLKNLDPSVTTADLEVLFSKFGILLSSKVEAGSGFVQFASQDSAISALNALRGTVFRGKTLYISSYEYKDERRDNCVEPEFTNLYVKNLPEDFTEDSLRKKFSESGKVFSVSVMKDEEGKSKGFGFVNFESHEDAVKAIQELNGSSVGGKKLYVGRALKKAEREELLKRGPDKHNSGINLYVKNLDASIDDSKLEEMFRSFGRVNSVKVMRDDQGVSKGFGFVSFYDEEAGKIAMRFLNGSFVKGKFVYVGVAQRKEERHKELQAVFGSTNTWKDIFQQCSNNANNDLNYPNPITYHHHGFYTCFPARASEQIPVKVSEPISVKVVSGLTQGQTTTTSSNTVRVYEQKQVQPCTANTIRTTQKQIWSKVQSKANNTMTQSEPSTATATATAKLVGSGAETSKKVRGILLEMEKSRMQKILNNPYSLAIHIVNATAAAQLDKSPQSKSKSHHHPNNSK